MSITRRSATRSSRAYWRTQAIRLASFHSPTGKTPIRSMFSGNRVWAFSSWAAIWTRWSTTIPSPRPTGKPTPIPRRRNGQAARLRRDGLLQPHPPHLPPQAHHHRRHRGKPAKACALRLLVRQAQAVDFTRFAGRSSDLRHGRARRHRDRERAQRRHGRAGHHVYRRHGL